MKIGIVSDTHGDYDVWQSIMENCFVEVDAIIHAGDVLYHGPRNPLVSGYDAKQLAAELNDLKIPIYAARGNCDAVVDQMVLSTPLMDPAAYLELAGKKVFVHHGHQEEILNRAVQSDNYQLVITGHTHIAKLERTPSGLLLNPGSPSLPKGENPVPSVAVWEENHIAILEVSGAVLAELEM